MHRYATVTASTLLLVSSLACTGDLMTSAPATPKYERSEIRGGRAPAPFKTMKDLPYYGGQIERSAKGYMQVSYSSEEATVEQLVEWWPAAVEAEGWTPKVTGPEPNGGFSGSYKTPDGSSGVLTISPTGTLWMVDLSVTPPIPDN